MVLNALQQLDVTLFLLVNRLPHPESLTRFFTILHFGTRGLLIYLIPLLAFLLVRKHRQAAQMTLTLVITDIIVDLALKPLFARPRPLQHLSYIFSAAPYPTTFSFPSAEAAVAFAFALFILWKFKSPHRYWVWAWACLVGFDRVYLGHHYPGDVAAGALVGLAVVGSAILLSGLISGRFRLLRK